MDSYNRIKEEVQKINELCNKPHLFMTINSSDYHVNESNSFSVNFINIYTVISLDAFCIKQEQEYIEQLLSIDVVKYWNEEDYRFQLDCTEEAIMLSRALYTHELNNAKFLLFPNFDFSYEERMALYDIYLSNYDRYTEMLNSDFPESYVF